MKVFTQKNIKVAIRVVLLTRLFVLKIDLVSPLLFLEAKNAACEFIKGILEEYEYCKKLMKKHFNKNLIMSEKEEEQFQLSNACWICKKLIDNDDEKVIIVT